MIKLSLTFTFLFGILSCFGQASYLDKDTSKYKNSPLYILKLPQQAPLLTASLIINVNDLDSISVKKNPESVKLYGKKAVNGAIVIYLKDRASVVSYDQLLTDFNIAYSDSKLPVFIDSVMTVQANDTYFELEGIKSVKIAKEKSTEMPYISILSIYPLNRPKKGEVYIKGKNRNVKAN